MEAENIKVYNALNDKFEEVERVVKTDDQWREILTSEQFKITRKQGTEYAFSGELLNNKKDGIYICVACKNHLFLSDTKFESGTGWPSFFKPVAEENVGTHIDNSLFMRRVEVHCSRCGAHLGHIFDDGPEPTKKRFCINSVALEFIEKGKD